MPDTIRTVLFDLDGTLLDTAPDLADALNRTLAEFGAPTLPYEEIRPAVSHGGMALIELGFGLRPGMPGFDERRQRLLDIYAANLANRTRPFPGMDEVLRQLEASGINWGVVTNKPAWLTEPLLEALHLRDRAAAVVSGDTVTERKPHPAPMLHACELAGSDPAACLYIGDAARDIEAGRRAGMCTLVALFGYIDPADEPATWGADGMVETPQEILRWLE